MSKLHSTEQRRVKKQATSSEKYWHLLRLLTPFSKDNVIYHRFSNEKSKVELMPGVVISYSGRAHHRIIFQSCCIQEEHVLLYGS